MMDYLFICRHNLARSVIAEAFFNLCHKEHSARSAGIDVDSQGESIPLSVWEALNEKGIDYKNHRTTAISERIIDQADKIIVLCGKQECPDYLLKDKNAGKVEFWYIPDPIDGQESILHARDTIERRVKSIKF